MLCLLATLALRPTPGSPGRPRTARMIQPASTFQAVSQPRTLATPAMTLGEQPVPERRDAGKQPVPERCEMDELLKQKFDDAEAQGFGPAYAMFWELNGDTFELVADYVTDERRKVLRAKRGNNDTFCASAPATPEPTRLCHPDRRISSWSLLSDAAQ
jgi:hypothetical protein